MFWDQKLKVGNDWSFIKLKMELQQWKNIMKLNIPNILKMYVNETVWQRYVEMDVFEFKQSSKIRQMVIPRSICACSIVLQHIKN